MDDGSLCLYVLLRSIARLLMNSCREVLAAFRRAQTKMPTDRDLEPET